MPKLIAVLVLACALIVPAPAGAATLSVQRAKRIAKAQARADADRLPSGVVFSGPVCKRRTKTIVRCGYRVQFTDYNDFGNLLVFRDTHLRIGLVQGFVLKQRVSERDYVRGLKRDEPPLPTLRP
jgi:hypothetical protein